MKTIREAGNGAAETVAGGDHTAGNRRCSHSSWESVWLLSFTHKHNPCTPLRFPLAPNLG